MKTLLKLSVVINLIFLSFSVFANSFFYTGNSWLTNGQTNIIYPENGFLFYSYHTDSKNYLSFSIYEVFPGTQFYNFTFKASGNRDLKVGVYNNASRSAFFEDVDIPGLDFSANGNGNNILSGSFNILDIVFSSDGYATSLAVDFIQNDENGTLGQSKGSLRYNSSVPINSNIKDNFTTPLPSSILLFLSGLTLITSTVKRRMIKTFFSRFKFFSC